MGEEVKYFHGKSVGQSAIPLIGPLKGQQCKIEKIEKDAGARNGWFTVVFKDGTKGLYAGEELK